MIWRKYFLQNFYELMEIYRSIFSFVELVCILGIAGISPVYLIWVLYKRKPKNQILLGLLFILVGTGSSILYYYYFYKVRSYDYLKKPTDLQETLIFTLTIILGFCSFWIILKPYYAKKQWKKKIPHCIIGFTIAILGYLYLY